MSWQEIMRAAEAAKSLMLIDRASGEKKFANLVIKNQGDGMVHFQRGLAYETLGELELATKDFRSALGLFAKTEWKKLAEDALKRIASRDFGKSRSRRPSARQYSKRSQSPGKTRKTEKSRRVWVVHGRDERLRAGVFAFLWSIGLEPLDFQDARKLTRKSLPYVGEILDAAFKHAQAVVVLLTPDDEARLRNDLLSPNDPPYEKQLTGQARPNVLFEAGMAFVSHPDQTILVQIGELRPFSDVAGKHMVNLDGSTKSRQEFASRLEDAHCPVSLRGGHWQAAGDLAPTAKTKSPVDEPVSPGPAQTDIQYLISQRVDDHAIRDRLLEALEHPKHRWRSIEKLAAVAAVPEDQAIALIRLDPRVRISKSKEKKIIVGLRSRVG